MNDSAENDYVDGQISPSRVAGNNPDFNFFLYFVFLREK